MTNLNMRASRPFPSKLEPTFLEVHCFSRGFQISFELTWIRGFWKISSNFLRVIITFYLVRVILKHKLVVLNWKALYPQLFPNHHLATLTVNQSISCVDRNSPQMLPWPDLKLGLFSTLWFFSCLQWTFQAERAPGCCGMLCGKTSTSGALGGTILRLKTWTF